MTILLWLLWWKPWLLKWVNKVTNTNKGRVVSLSLRKQDQQHKEETTTDKQQNSLFSRAHHYPLSVSPNSCDPPLLGFASCWQRMLLRLQLQFLALSPSSSAATVTLTSESDWRTNSKIISFFQPSFLTRHSRCGRASRPRPTTSPPLACVAATAAAVEQRWARPAQLGDSQTQVRVRLKNTIQKSSLFFPFLSHSSLALSSVESFWTCSRLKTDLVTVPSKSILKPEAYHGENLQHSGEVSKTIVRISSKIEKWPHSLGAGLFL